MYNLRAKKQRNDAYTQISTFDGLNECLIHVSNEEYSNCEITLNGKLFFVFTIDEKTKILLNTIKEISGDKEPEIIPKTAKKARKSPKKEKEIIIGS
jgi:hypothetical protein